MQSVKAQSATEFLIQYSWAIVILVVALSAVVLIATTQHQVASTPSYCYISAQLNCYDTVVGVNTIGSNITTYFTNTQTKPIILTGYTVAPTSTSSYYQGTCNVTTLGPGQSAQCSSYVQGFVPAGGSQLNPIFYVQYKLCNGSCSTAPSSQAQVSTAGTAVVTTPAIHPLTASTTVLVSSSTTLVSSSTLSSSSSTLSSSSSTLSSSSSVFSSSTLSSSTLSSSSSTLSSSTLSSTSSTLHSSSSTLSSSTLSSSTLSSSTLSSTTTTIQYYTVTLQFSPALASGSYFACFTTSSTSQTCTSQGTSSSVQASVAAGSTLTDVCYSSTNGGGEGDYSFSSWSGAVSSSTSCLDPGSTVNGAETIQINFALNTYTVTLEENPSDAANYYGACVAFNEYNGTAIGQGTCAGPSSSGGSGDTYTVQVPVGTTITYLCQAGWASGSGLYSFSDWSGAISSSNGCYNPDSLVTSSETIDVNYASTYSYSCGDPGAQNPGGGWEGPYDIQTSGSTPIANPAYILVPYYAAGYDYYDGVSSPNNNAFSYSGGTFTYDWNSNTRDAENIYYGSFYLEVQNPSSGCWGPVQGGTSQYYPSSFNGGGYSDPDSGIASSAGSSGPSASMSWSPSEVPNTNYRVLAYIFVRDNGQNAAWVDLSSYSGTVTT